MLEGDDGLLSRCSFVYVGLRQPSGFLPALYSHHQPTLSVIDGQHSSCRPKPRQEAHPPMGRGVWLPTGWTGTGSPCRRSVTGIARVTGSCFRGGCPWSSWKSGAEEERRIGRWPRGWPLFRLRIRAHACQTGPAGRQTNDIRVCLAASMGTTEPPLPRTESLIVSVVSEKLDEDFALVDDVEAVVSWLSDISSLAPILQVPIADGYELFFEPC